MECTADGEAAICSTAPGGGAFELVAEICNGEDDDCDERVDESGPVLTQGPIRVSEEGFAAETPRLAAAGDNIALTWLSRRNSPGQIHLAVFVRDQLAELGRSALGDPAVEAIAPQVTWNGAGYAVAYRVPGEGERPITGRVLTANAEAGRIEDGPTLSESESMVPVLVWDQGAYLLCRDRTARTGMHTGKREIFCGYYDVDLVPDEIEDTMVVRWGNTNALGSIVPLHAGPGQLLLAITRWAEAWVTRTDGEAFQASEEVEGFVHELGAALEAGVDGIAIAWRDRNTDRISFLRTSYLARIGDSVEVAPELEGAQIWPHMVWAGGQFIALWRQAQGEALTVMFRRLTRDGEPLSDARPAGLPDRVTAFHAIAVGDVVYLTWSVVAENGLPEVWIAAGPLGCGVVVP